MAISCIRFALLVFASVAILGMLVKAEVKLQAKNIGSCDNMDCKTNILAEKTCNAGLGRCTESCNNDCCTSNCAKQHSGGVGYCDDSLGGSNSLCQCNHPC
ncbi:hypothetical protein ACFX1T_012892 [Malus domestica]